MSTQGILVTPHVEGIASRQAHADLPADTFEREIGRDGFSGAATHMYHRNPPTAWIDVEGPVRPRAFRPDAVVTASPSPWDALTLAQNRSLRLRYWRVERSMDHLVRNADGDDLLFLHSGRARLFCDYGHLPLRQSDYAVIPRGTMWRLELDDAAEFMLLEATGSSYRLPERGMLGRHAPFDPGVLAKPVIDDAFVAQRGFGTWRVRVKRGNQIGTITYPFNPLDAVGWKGDLYPVRLNMQDVRAVSSHRLHLPPSVRTSFIADRFIVCSLTPRPVESDAGAMKLPFFHNNDDYDEIIFYHGGTHSSRGNSIGPGTMTFHPAGLTHGPHPQTLPHMLNHPAKMFDGYSVAIDALDPFELPDPLPGLEIADYATSWRQSTDFAPDAVAPPR